MHSADTFHRPGLPIMANLVGAAVHSLRHRLHESPPDGIVNAPRVFFFSAEEDRLGIEFAVIRVCVALARPAQPVSERREAKAQLSDAPGCVWWGWTQLSGAGVSSMSRP
jgi:hypothetical protein